MGFLDFLGDVALVLDSVSGPSGKKYTVKCESFELFEIGTTWRGTVRVQGAGAHLQTIKTNATTTIFLPDRSDNSQYTERGLLRKDLREWVGKNFSLSGSIAKDMVMLNEGENCLSIEGYVKKVNGTWKFTSGSGSATNYGAYKLIITDEKGNLVGNEELFYLFKADTLGRVSSVDVSDGF